MYKTNTTKMPNYPENFYLVINEPLEKICGFCIDGKVFFFFSFESTTRIVTAEQLLLLRHETRRGRSHTYSRVCAVDVGKTCEYVVGDWLSLIVCHWVISTKKHIIIILHESSNNRPGFDRLMFFHVEPV